jgi:hypothetical protein
LRVLPRRRCPGWLADSAAHQPPLVPSALAGLDYFGSLALSWRVARRALKRGSGKAFLANSGIGAIGEADG